MKGVCRHRASWPSELGGEQTPSWLALAEPCPQSCGPGEQPEQSEKREAVGGVRDAGREWRQEGKRPGCTQTPAA